MSFRGRGRGRGRGGYGGFLHSPQLSWEHFPEIMELGSAAGVVEKLALAKSYAKLHSYWKASPYHYEGDKSNSKRAKREGIERFSDIITSETKAKPPLSHFIIMEPEYVPAELTRSEKKRPGKQIRWNPDSDLHKWDLLEKLEHACQSLDANEKKEEGEGEDEDEEGSDKEEEAYSDDGDYNQNEDFDDDEDDFNMADDYGDEPEL